MGAVRLAAGGGGRGVVGGGWRGGSGGGGGGKHGQLHLACRGAAGRCGLLHGACGEPGMRRAGCRHKCLAFLAPGFPQGAPAPPHTPGTSMPGCKRAAGRWHGLAAAEGRGGRGNGRAGMPEQHDCMCCAPKNMWAASQLGGVSGAGGSTAAHSGAAACPLNCRASAHTPAAPSHPSTLPWIAASHCKAAGDNPSTCKWEGGSGQACQASASRIR